MLKSREGGGMINQCCRPICFRSESECALLSFPVQKESIATRKFTFCNCRSERQKFGFLRNWLVQHSLLLCTNGNEATAPFYYGHN